MAQIVPFHRSVSVVSRYSGEGMAVAPRLAWPWLGVGWASHVWPFQRKARVSEGPVAP